mgnify:CR=1 FL=1
MLEIDKAAAKKELNKIKGKKEEKKNSMADLEKMILAKRDKGFGGFLNYMEAKYGGNEAEDEEMEDDDNDDDDEKITQKNIHSKRIKKSTGTVKGKPSP